MLTLQERIDRVVEYRAAAIDWFVGAIWGSYPECDPAWLADLGERRWIRSGRALAALIGRTA